MSPTRPLSSSRKRRSFWLFSGVIPARRNAAVAVCVVFASIADGFGIATLLPLIAVLGDENSKTNGLSRAILHLLQRLHVPAEPAILLGIVAGGVLLKAGLMVLALRQIGNTVAQVATQLRMNLVDALIHARWSYYVRQPVGRFSNALGGEATAAGEAYNATMQMLSQCVQATVYLLVAALLSWRLALFTLLVCALMLGTLYRFLLAAKESAKTQATLMRSILSRLTDVLIGIKPMKAMSRQARFALLFQRDLKALKKAARRQTVAKNLNKTLQEPILALCLSLGIYVALKLLHMPVGEVIVMSILLAKTVMIVGKAQQELQNVNAHEHGLKGVRRAIAEAQDACEAAHGGRAPTLAQDIVFSDISFAYGERHTLDRVDLKLSVGGIVALTGPSGAGKTTLVDLLLGFHSPQSGEVLIDGVPMRELDLIAWRALIGYVPQELILFHDSITANITLGEPRFSEADVERALRAAGAWDFVQSLPEGGATVVGERGSVLSGGQRQRIALARALVHEPKLLILDEATSALDPETEDTIIRNVQALAVERGLTVLSVSHHPAWIAAAQRVLRLESGRLMTGHHDLARGERNSGQVRLPGKREAGAVPPKIT